VRLWQLAGTLYFRRRTVTLWPYGLLRVGTLVPTRVPKFTGGGVFPVRGAIPCSTSGLPWNTHPHECPQVCCHWPSVAFSPCVQGVAVATWRPRCLALQPPAIMRVLMLLTSRVGVLAVMMLLTFLVGVPVFVCCLNLALIGAYFGQ
jgi:hypothetical protein